MTIGSLFSGIGGIELGLEWAGLGPVKWQVEIEESCRRVLARHWPDVKRFEDIRECGKHNLEPVDIICGGSPCQDLSVAGKRAGLEGARSGLFYEFIRIVKELKPIWVVFENVPGLLSSGDDFDIVLDEFENAGYLFDADILDAQFFGVAQRRRRFFICAKKVKSILKEKTTSSGIIIAQCVAEILGCILAVLRIQSGQGFLKSDSQDSELYRTLRKRIRLFSLDKPEAASILAANLAALQLQSETERGNSESNHGMISPHPTGLIPNIRQSEERVQVQMEEVSRNIGMSWSSILEDVLQMANGCITSTSISGIIESKIFICAEAMVRTASLISPLMTSSPSFYSAGLSILTALTEYINYARFTISDLFSNLESVSYWHDFLGEAEPICTSLGSIRVKCFEEVLPLSKGMRWNPAPRRKTGESVAGTLKGGSGRRGYPDPSDGNGGGLIPEIAGCLQERDSKGADSDTKPGHLIPVAYNIQQNDGGNHKRKDRPNGGMYVNETGISLTVGSTDQTLAVAYRTSGNCGPFETGEITGCLNTMTDKNQNIIAFTERSRKEGRSLEYQENISYALADPGSGGQAHSRNIVHNMAVRRLTPTECERLQGFPDGWTAGESDSARYRMLGNAVAIPVVKWIGKRMAKIEQQRKAGL